MKWSFKVAKIAGTEVRLHLTFILLVMAIGMMAYASPGGAETALRAVALLLGVFFCVLLHEFGHVAAALRYGITTPKITLLPIGGLAHISKIPKEPAKELVVAIAGPIVNIIIAFVLIAISGGIPSPKPGMLSLGSEYPIIESLIWINLFLAIFNLIPAFPMDGGRIFRAFLSFFMSRPSATHFAVKVGQTIAFAGGLWAMANGQLFLAILSVFIFFAGHGEELLVHQESLLEGHTADEAGMTDFRVFQLEDRLSDVIEVILEGDQDCFPVVNENRDCIAALGFESIIATVQQKGPDARVRDAVNAVPEQIREDAPAFDAYQRLMRSTLPGAAIVDQDGHLSKWLTPRQFQEFMAVQALASHGEGIRFTKPVRTST